MQVEDVSHTAMNDEKTSNEPVEGEFLSPIDEFWLDLGQNIVREAVNKQEDAAKQLISITSILQGVYFAAISFSELKKTLVAQNLHGLILIELAVLFASPIIFWIISLRFAVKVLLPIVRTTNLYSPELIGTMHQEAIYHKQNICLMPILH
jgi:hypothetical protein